MKSSSLPSPEHSPQPAAPAPRGHLSGRSLLLPGLLVLALGLRLVDLDRLPGEIYGDIAILYDYLAEILAGRWPYRFVLSAGPLYHYLIAPVALSAGLNYFALKLASVLISLLVVAATYALARELLDVDGGLLAALIAAVSSWLLIFSRLGNSQILIPLLVVGTLWFAARLARTGSTKHAAGCALVAALGLYTYPQTFVLPPVMFVTLLCLMGTRLEVRPRHLLIFGVTTLLCALPFGFIVAADPANFFTGYIGGKLGAQTNALRVLLGNLLRAMLALHVRGDVVFRSNPTLRPHLDPLSGACMLAGLVFWLLPARRHLSPLLLLPLVLLQLPSVLVLSAPIEVPSASRTLGIAPLAYVLAASGLWWLWRSWPAGWWARAAMVACALLAITALNADRYFRLYAEGLPDRNTPFGRVIAEYLDTLPPATEAYLIGCCWGEWGQPEPKGVRYALRVERRMHFLDPAKLTCRQLAALPRPSVLIWQPRRELPAPQLSGCTSIFTPAIPGGVSGTAVFRAVLLASNPG